MLTTDVAGKKRAKQGYISKIFITGAFVRYVDCRFVVEDLGNTADRKSVQIILESSIGTSGYSLE